MSGALLVLEAVGISAAAVGVVLAQNPPEDLSAWWERQEWLHRMIMPADDAEPPRGLSLLHWEDSAAPGVRPAADVPADLPADLPDELVDRRRDGTA
jgi:hypothetical protein